MSGLTKETIRVILKMYFQKYKNLSRSSFSLLTGYKTNTKIKINQGGNTSMKDVFMAEQDKRHERAHCYP